MNGSQAIHASMTVFEITEGYPETIEVFVASGFPKLRDPELRRAQGRALTVAAAAKLRRLDLEELLGRLRAAAARAAAGAGDVTLGAESGAELQLLPEGDLRVSGLLPCPVRLPILEALQREKDRIERERGLRVGCSLAAAAVGGDALNRAIVAARSEADLPEIFISAGFESFFDRRTMRRFKDQGVFVDLAPPGQNRVFGELGLRDPDGHFTMLGMVPAVFLVNRNLLGDDPAPRTWEDVLHPRFRGRLVLPVGDFDLFNGMLLTLAARYGDAAVEALAENMLAARHPAETVGRFSSRQAAQPAVSIIPYFFSKMTLKSGVLSVVWPEDGAVVSPIFMLVKKSAMPLSGELASVFLGKEVGELIAQRGLMPVLNPEVENRVPEGARFLWLGWERVRELDLGEEIPRLERIFRSRAPEGALAAPSASSPAVGGLG
jgi:ABC-type Fe3+ transport system substrate-binding protein